MDYSIKQGNSSQHFERVRLVDLTILGEELWCNNCNLALSLKNIIAERRRGVASILKVKCMYCEISQDVNTHFKPEGEGEYPINLKVASGMIDIGSGETHVNRFLSALDVPSMTAYHLKKCEQIVGAALEEVASNSCVDAIRLERKLTLEANEKEKTNTLSENEEYLDSIQSTAISCTPKNIIQVESETSSTIFQSPSTVQIKKIPAEVASTIIEVKNEEPSELVKLIVSYDAGWQKRGTGRSYNSLSGHGTILGHFSGKILSFTARCITCRKCSLGYHKEDHNCRANYQGSAKGMEPDMAVQLILNNDLFVKEKVSVKVLIGDDDSSTIAALRRLSNDEIEKWSDYNHTFKALRTSFYNIKLPSKLMEYFSHCFSYAVKQNKGNAATVEKALRSIVPHAFGDHTISGNWCEGKNCTQYIHKNLPYGKPLQDPQLQISLTKIFSRIADNADKICNCGSTQANEAFNNCMSKKCPKAQYYSSSESMCFRLAAAVCQMNMGNSYLIEVYKKLKISPSQKMQRFQQKKDEKKKIKSISSKSIEIKKRRFELKKLRSSKTASHNRKEGVTYESGVALHDVSELICTYDSNIPQQDMTLCKIVIFDLETTGLAKNDEIIQIAACSNESSFNVYIIPSKPISKGASTITGLQSFDGDLYLNSKKVQAFPAKAAFLEFLKYLDTFQSGIILVAHDDFRFDVPKLLKIAYELDSIVQFKTIVKGFSDSIMIFKNILKERRKEKKSFSIESLVKCFLPDANTTELHNAVYDVKILQQLLIKLEINDETIKKSVKSIDQISYEQKLKLLEASIKCNLQTFKNVVSSRIVNKMAKAGIFTDTLRRVFDKNGFDGIRLLFSECVNGKPRITTNKRIIENICKVFTLNV